MLPKMFRKKRKTLKYRFKHGKSPVAYKNNMKVGGFQRLSKKPSPLLKKLKKIFTLATVTGIFIIFLYTIFFAGYFSVTKIEVVNKTFDNETLSEELKTNLANSIGKNIIFTKTDELENQIIKSFPELERISVKKDYPHTLSIEFFQYELLANILSESNTIKKSYIVNSIGYAIKEDFENPSLPYIRIKSDEPVNTEKPVIEGQKLKYILDAISYFQDKFGMKIKEVEYKPLARELHLLTEKDFYIWLDIQIPSEAQFKKLKKALVKLDIYTENLDYIDLRIAGSNGDKIIYKRK